MFKRNHSTLRDTIGFALIVIGVGAFQMFLLGTVFGPVLSA